MADLQRDDRGQDLGKDRPQTQQTDHHLETVEAAPGRDGYTKPLRRKWYRTSFFNITVLSICAFIAPGLWAAINGLGAGGAASPYYVNTANSVIFVLQFVVCIVGSWVIARVGLKWTFVSGMSCFTVYASALYCHVKFGTNWYLMLACVPDGIFSGIFWLTEGAIVLAYPEKHKPIGGSAALGVHVSGDERGHISVETYLIFIGIQAIGPFVAALLSPPHKVQRSDNTTVKISLPRDLKTELRAMWELLRRKDIMLLLPMIFQSVFSEAFFSTYNATYFTVRSRALASLQKVTLNTRAIAAFTFVYTFELSLWIYAMVVNKDYESHSEPHTLDWESSGFGHGVCVYLLLLVGFNLMYDHLYWLIGSVNKSGGEIIRLSAVIRGIESCGQAISHGINSIDQGSFPLSGPVAVKMSHFPWPASSRLLL